MAPPTLAFPWYNNLLCPFTKQVFRCNGQPLLFTVELIVNKK